VGATRSNADTAASPSDRIHALVDSLGPRSGLVVTIDGVLATLASSVGDDEVSLGRAGDHIEGESLLGTVLGDPHDFPLLNDAFAIDPVVVDVRPGASVADPVVIVHVVSGSTGTAVFPRTVVRTGAGATAGVIELVVDATTGLLADGHTAWTSGPEAPAERLVVPVTELQVHDGASLAYVQLRRGPGRRLRPPPHRLRPGG